MSVLPKLQGYGAPNEDTKGAIDQIYKDLNTGREYICTEIHSYSRYKVSKTIYTWTEKSIDLATILDEYATDVEVDMAIDELKDEISAGGVVPDGNGLAIYAEIVD